MPKIIREIERGRERERKKKSRGHEDDGFDNDE